MYIETDTTNGRKLMATEELRCIRPIGDRIEFWEYGWWVQPDYLYCQSAEAAQCLYGRLCYHYSQEQATGQKVVVNVR